MAKKLRINTPSGKFYFVIVEVAKIRKRLRHVFSSATAAVAYGERVETRYWKLKSAEGA